MSGLCWLQTHPAQTCGPVHCPSLVLHVSQPPVRELAVGHLVCITVEQELAGALCAAVTCRQGLVITPGLVKTCPQASDIAAGNLSALHYSPPHL